MGNKIKHLLEGFKYQEIATIYCILKYINEKDLEIYIEKQNEEDAQIILDKNHIIDLQFKNKIGKQITIEEFCKWLSNFEGNKLDIHLLKKLVEDKNRKIIFMTSGRCKDDTYIFTDKGKKNLTKKDLNNYLEFQYKIDLESSDEEWAEHNQDLLYEDIRSDNIKQLIAKDGDKIIGTANIIVKADFFEIDNLYVSHEYRRKGVAMHLINFAVKNEQKKNVLLVADANDTPKYMYEKIGFKKISEQDFYLKTKL